MPGSDDRRSAPSPDGRSGGRPTGAKARSTGSARTTKATPGRAGNGAGETGAAKGVRAGPGATKTTRVGRGAASGGKAGQAVTRGGKAGEGATRGGKAAPAAATRGGKAAPAAATRGGKAAQAATGASRAAHGAAKGMAADVPARSLSPPRRRTGPAVPVPRRGPSTAPGPRRGEATGLGTEGREATDRRAPTALWYSQPLTSARPPKHPRLRKELTPERALSFVVVVLLVLGLAGSIIDGANRPANPRLVPAPDPAAAKGSPAMGSGSFSVVGSHLASACLLEAVTAEQQENGLMNRRSVAPYAGMAFVFGQPTTVRFWMKNTLIPLSIAWFDAGGRYLSSALMPPCPPQTAVCPTYGPTEPYTLAVEVPAGHLRQLGIGPGATAHLGAPCA